jgi:inorganic pyrophosphatase
VCGGQHKRNSQASYVRSAERRVAICGKTPKGSRNKYPFNPALGVFELRRVVPRRAKVNDGDPLDALLLLVDSAPTSCVIRVRAIGAI